MKSEVIYQNFAALEVSFQCALPRSILAQLAKAKSHAQAMDGYMYTTLGSNDLQVMVFAKGTRGFTYQFNTGLTGQTWLVVANECAENWNAHVKVSELQLALYGYEETKDEIIDILTNDLQATELTERISRVDYCIDFAVTGDFRPERKDFICHGRTKKKNQDNQITIGQMPNRQIILYNKADEISHSHKSYMWDIWDLEEGDFKKDIWRLEIRAGKKELDAWDIKKFDDLEEAIEDVFLETLKDFRYTGSSIWKMAKKAIRKDLFSYNPKTDEETVLETIGIKAEEYCENEIENYLIRYMDLTGKDISEIPGVLELIDGQVLEEIREKPNKFSKKSILNIKKGN